MWEVKSVENDELVESEPVEESEKEPQVSAVQETELLPIRSDSQLSPPEDTNEVHSGRAFKRRTVISRPAVMSCEAKKKQYVCVSSGPRDHYIQ